MVSLPLGVKAARQLASVTAGETVMTRPSPIARFDPLPAKRLRQRGVAFVSLGHVLELLAAVVREHRRPVVQAVVPPDARMAAADLVTLGVEDRVRSPIVDREQC